MAVDSELKNYLKAVRIEHDQRIDNNYMRKGTLPEYQDATSLQSGLMSAADKTKLDGIDAGASSGAQLIDASYSGNCSQYNGLVIAQGDNSIIVEGYDGTDFNNIYFTNGQKTANMTNTPPRATNSRRGGAIVTGNDGLIMDGDTLKIADSLLSSSGDNNISKSALESILAKFNATPYTPPEDTTPADTTPSGQDTTPADTTPADTTPADTTPSGSTSNWLSIRSSFRISDSVIKFNLVEEKILVIGIFLDTNYLFSNGYDMHDTCTMTIQNQPSWLSINSSLPYYLEDVSEPAAKLHGNYQSVPVGTYSFTISVTVGSNNTQSIPITVNVVEESRTED